MNAAAAVAYNSVGDTSKSKIALKEALNNVKLNTPVPRNGPRRPSFGYSLGQALRDR